MLVGASQLMANRLRRAPVAAAGMTVLRQLRLLVLGETRSLPLGVAAAVLLAALVRELAGPDGWWRHGGGWLLLALVLVALWLSLRGAARANT